MFRAGVHELGRALLLKGSSGSDTPKIVTNQYINLCKHRSDDDKPTKTWTRTRVKLSTASQLEGTSGASVHHNQKHISIHRTRLFGDIHMRVKVYLFRLILLPACQSG